MKKINASPTKSFFIKSLVKDVQLVPSILDLVDNSIDSHIKNNLKERRRISILFSKDKFVIEDNCGGIKKEEVYEHVFRFGMPAETKGRTIGVYGIGLKRAIFKLGENILIESDDGEEFFSVRIDKNWLADEENWELDFECQEKSKGSPLTRITVTEIFPNIAEEIGSITFENKLRDGIKDTYSIFMEDRVTIEVNDKPVERYDFAFLFDVEKNFAPFHKKYIFDDIEVEIYAGYTASKEGRPHGWYVFCNDRLVVKNDTSEKTGWGEDDRKYHYPQDDYILGLVFFRSDNPMSLPCDTTKTNIQEDSRVYRRAQIEMKNINNRLLDVTRLAWRTEDPVTKETIGSSLFEGVQTRLRKDIQEESEEIVPAVKGELRYERLTHIPKVAHILYTKETELVKRVKEKFGDPYMSNKKMGEKTFDYFVKLEGLEDEKEE